MIIFAFFISYSEPGEPISSIKTVEGGKFCPTIFIVIKVFDYIIKYGCAMSHGYVFS